MYNGRPASVEVSSHLERKSESFQFGQKPAIVGYTQTIDLLRKMQILSVFLATTDNVELNREPEYLVKIRLLPAFTQYTNGILTECNDSLEFHLIIVLPFCWRRHQLIVDMS